jgi:hypothetical protein
VGTSFQSRCDWANQQSEPPGVRIRVRLDKAPELADLPWEYLYKRQNFLILRDATPIVRHLNHGEPLPGPLVKPPISMMVLISSSDPRLDVEGEWNRIKDALKPLENRNVLGVTRVPAQRQALVNSLLANNRQHILHFVGHSGFQAGNGEPVLRLDDATIPAAFLTKRLDPTALRLVVLNSCDGARSAADDAFSALAHDFVKLGVMSVVAMQFRITDEAAIDFASGLYGGIAENWSIEASVARGRQAIFGKDNPTEWGTPVLFTRGRGSRLFRFDIPSEQQAQQLQIDRLAQQARLALDQKQWDISIQKLQKIKEIMAQMFGAS